MRMRLGYAFEQAVADRAGASGVTSLSAFQSAGSDDQTGFCLPVG